MATDNKYVKYLDKSVKIIDKPKVNENISVYVRPGDLVDFKIPGINLEDLEYELVGGDIVINIPGNGTFTFVSMALMGYNDTPPKFASSSGKELSLGDILSEIEEINALPIDSLVSNIDINIPDNTAKENEEGDATQQNPEQNPQIIIQEIEVTQEQEQQEDFLNDNEFEIPPVEVPELVENDFTSYDDSTSDNSSSKTEEEQSITEGTKPLLTFDIDIQHLDSSESTTTGVMTVEGGGGTTYDNIHPGTNASADRAGIVRQTNAEILDYRHVSSTEASSLVINGDDSNYFNANTISRTIKLSPNQPIGFAVESITISSADFPEGFSILNATANGDSWTITKDDPNTTAVEGFTLDANGNIEIKISMDKNQETNFEMKIEATSEFNIENISEELRDGVETPVETTLDYFQIYGVNVREIDNLSDPNQYLFEQFLDGAGQPIESGFVISTNINDNIIYGSQKENVSNTITGGLANDTITTGIENDIVDGNIGNDTLDYSTYNNIDNDLGIVADLTTGSVTKKYASNNTDTISNIENVTGTQDNDTITGNSEVNTLQGLAGNDTLRGMAGSDTLDGGIGNDVLEGGADADIIKGGSGNDTASYENASGSVSVDLDDGNGKGVVSGADGNDTLFEIENVRGSAYADIITGDNNSNILEGLGGDDTFFVSGGSDTIYGGSGANDIYGDTLNASNSSVAHRIDLEGGQVIGEGTSKAYGIENVVGSSNNDFISGSSVKNTLQGGEGDDTIKGLGGDDFLYGNEGNDTISGGAGNDFIDGGDDALETVGDFVDYSDVTAGGIRIDLSIQDGTTSQNTINAGEDTLLNIENVIGTNSTDILIDDAASKNTILAEGGDDYILVKGGNDYINGGVGNDTLSF